MVERIISRKLTADGMVRRLSATRYFTGKPCKNGHIAPRMYSNRGCVECLKERSKPYVQAWWDKNGTAYMTARYKLMPEAYKAAAKAWAAAHPEYAKVRGQRRRARMLGVAGSYTVRDVLALFRKQHGHCLGCSCSLQEYHVDHIHPVSRGGSNNPENLQLLCPTCNRSKGNKTMAEWLLWRAA